MLRASHLKDPVVEILRMAYRRGLVILREQEEAREAADAPSVEEDAPKAMLGIQRSEIPVIQKVKGGT